MSVGSTDIADPSNQLFAAAYGIVALVGGIFGLRASRKWGGTKSLVGKALIFFGLGLLAQEFGQLAYSFYIYALEAEVPYPSIGDVGYFGSVLLYIYGAYLLAKAAGVKFSLKNITNKLVAIIIPAVILIISYSVFLRAYEFDFSVPLTIFLDFGYPLGQAIYIAIAVLTYMLSRRFLGGVMRPAILLLIFALFVQYVADFTFLYGLQHEAIYPGGWNDYLYFVAYTIMGYALLNFDTIAQNLKSSQRSE